MKPALFFSNQRRRRSGRERERDARIKGRIDRVIFKPVLNGYNPFMLFTSHIAGGMNWKEGCVCVALDELPLFVLFKYQRDEDPISPSIQSSPSSTPCIKWITHRLKSHFKINIWLNITSHSCTHSHTLIKHMHCSMNEWWWRNRPITHCIFH